MAPKYNSFTMKFKLAAIDLATRLGSIRAAARQLRIGEKNIRYWKKQADSIKAVPRNDCTGHYLNGAMGKNAL